MSSSSTYTLIEHGWSAVDHRYVDTENRPAFTIVSFNGDRNSDPNMLVRLTREKEWSQQHPDIMGPSSAYYYLGYDDKPVHLAFGNGERMSMMDWMKLKKEGSSSRYYTGQNGKEYKWRITEEKMECLQGSTVLATWERAAKTADYNATVILKHAALPIVTEIFATLTLNRMRLELRW